MRRDSPQRVGRQRLAVAGMAVLVGSTGLRCASADSEFPGASLERSDAGTASFENQAPPPIYFEIQSLSAQSAPIEQVGPILESAGSMQPIVVPAPASLHGILTCPVSSAAAAATVYFTASGGIPNRPQASVVATSDSTGAFDVQLPPSLSDSFSVAVYQYEAPGTYKTPPQYFSDLEAQAIPPQLPLTLWNPIDLVQLTGTVDVASVPDGGTPDPVGIQVSVVDATAITGSSQLLGQPVLTSTGGAFSLTLPPYCSVYLAGECSPPSILLDFGSGAPSGIPFPTLSLPPASAIAVLGVQVTPSAITLGVASTTLSGQVTDASHNTVPNAQVIIIAQPSPVGAAPPFAFQTYVDTGADGSYSTTVYTTVTTDQATNETTYGPVYYSVIAVPNPASVLPGGPGLCRPPAPQGTSSGSSMGLVTAEVTNAAIMNFDLVCDTLIDISGQALADPTTQDSIVVGGTAIQALMSPTPDLPSGPSFTTTADQTGSFALELPVGAYTITEQPPTDLQPFGYTTFTVTTSSTTQPLLIHLPAPFQLQGTLFLGDTSHPLASTINAFEVVGSYTFPIATATSGSDGSYSITLPGIQVLTQ